MALTKVTYVDGVTIIGAKNLNDIQDELIRQGEQQVEDEASLALKANTADVNAALALKADKSDTYTKAEVDASLALKADKSDTYTKAQVDSALGLKADAEDVYTKTDIDTALEDYAKVDGSYEGMTVGNAEQLISSVKENDKVPYFFRTSGGNAEIGNRENDTIVGGTVAWNQVFNTSNAPSSTTNNGITYSKDSNGRIVLNGTATANSTLAVSGNSVIKDHVYFLKNLKSNAFAMWDAYALDYEVVKKASGNNNYLSITVLEGVTVTNYLYEGMAIDLTQMFGITIADYIYSLEQANAGAGVAWFKKLFPKDYYEYNAGEMLHVSGLQSHDMTGFNQWDEEWELGALNSSGNPESDSTRIRSKNFTEVIADAQYYIRTAVITYVWFYFYDANKNFISRTSIRSHSVFTTPSNCRFIKINPTSDYGTTYKNDICINLHWDGERDGEYEPYVKHSYPLDDSLTLRGIPKLDSSNNLYYDGDTYEHDGTVTRKYGIVDLGTLNWTLHPSYANVFYADLIGKVVNNSNILCSIYPNGGIYANYANISNNNVYSSSSSARIAVKDTAYSTANAFKTAMSGVYLVYELAEPTTESAEPFADPQIVDNWGTEEYVTSSIIPVGHDTDYPIDIKAKVEATANNPSSDGIYILSYQNGTATYAPLASTDTITNIIARLEALEGGE